MILMQPERHEEGEAKIKRFERMSFERALFVHPVHPVRTPQNKKQFVLDDRAIRTHP